MVQKIRRVVTLLGPAFVAAIAYVDPGNFAANFSAGAQYGYLLLWVLIVANIMASLVQYSSAKVGLVTGKSIPEIMGERLPKRGRYIYWIQAELIAIATDIAEVLGGAIALQLLFNLPLLVGGGITGIVSLLLLMIHSRRGEKVFERVVTGLLLIIPIGFFTGLIMQPPAATDVFGGLLPRLDGKETILLAVAMLGATVMPHVVYLHSALARDRHGKVPRKNLAHMLRTTRVDVGGAMLLAGTINISMLILAATALRGVTEFDLGTFPGIFAGLKLSLGSVVAYLFAIGFLVSGFASTAVGAHAGAVIMDGLIHRRIKPLYRRLITIIPALFIIAIGIEPTKALVISQVVLSFGIPFILVPLVLITASRRIMGESINSRWLTYALGLIALIITVLNGVLIVLTFSS